MILILSLTMIYIPNLIISKIIASYFLVNMTHLVYLKTLT